ncbi:alpha-L-rhamnosidase [Ruania zhangjianzhongii]|uniref:alpha-L-rhamnosidase n=1 Tax=Ruania zhangjianzhongii TaxID=2603206 RepID=UPI0011CC3E61|nr:alpha-L-rhamnosidase [Ruania zhangjianzhongii]
MVSTQVSDVRVERRRDRAVADTPAPRLSWTISTTISGWNQTAAEVRLDEEQVVRLEGDQSVFVDWPFPPLAPHSRHVLEVRVFGPDGDVSSWSSPVEMQSGFLADGAWQAQFIELGNHTRQAQPGLLRTEVQIAKEVRAATLYATAHGLYQVSINGSDVDDSVLKPGWTSYQYRLEHEATDVTAMLTTGGNALGIRLAGGWFTEEYGFHGQARRVYGDQPAAAAQIHIAYTDGTEDLITTGAHWRGAALGKVERSGIYQGERIDARRALPGWDEPGFEDSDWSAVAVREVATVPEAAVAEPVRRTQELPVREVITTPAGRTVLDFGQNLVGWLRLRVRGPRGQEIVVRHAEVLEHGELGVRPLRHARATDEFVLSGGEDLFEPEFTFHGFRYAEIDGWPGECDPAAVTAVVVGSDMRRTGWFECSEPMVNRLHENVVWGMRGNFLSIPTDCPQRDERMGWTGDIQVFSPTAATLFDADAFLAAWLKDVAAEQAAAGGVCGFVVPQVLPDGDQPAAAWGDAATVVPTVLFERFADRRALADQYPSMRAWVDVLLELAGEEKLWEGMFQYGDWLDPDAPADRPGAAKVDSDIVASAHLVRSTRLVARAAAELGHDQDADRYGALAEEARGAWVRAYTTSEGRIVSDAQTAYAMAIAYELVDAELRTVMGHRLAQLVRESGYRMGTGFVGTPIIADALTTTGHPEVAGALLLQTDVPSWLYAVTMGATTIWERWDSMLPDGTINPGEMTSFNHYAFGAVADWLYRRLAGLGPDTPGYQRLRIAPVPISGLSSANARHETPYGPAEAGWQASDGQIRIHAVLPPNTTAVVELPGEDIIQVGSGRHEWSIPDRRAQEAPQ